MSFRSVVGLLGGASCLLFVTVSRAECSKDTDCKGDRICEEGVCKSPPPAVVAAPVVSQPADAATVLAPVAEAPPAPAPSPAPAVAPPGPRVIRVDDAPIQDERGYSVADSDERRAKRNWKRHSTGMMVGGIVMTSLSFFAFTASLLGAVASSSCDSYESYGTYSYSRDCNHDGLIYGGLVTGLVLVGVGIPLIVSGAKREPRTASVTPWATPHAGGLSLRLAL